MVKIRSCQVVRCPPRWLLLRVEDSDGEIGWGEAIGDLHEEVEAALDAIGQRVIGENADSISRIIGTQRRGRFWRGGPVLGTAISALEMALWDLKGKRLGAAVHQLLGGPVRDRVAVYRNLWGRNPEEFAASAKIALKEGLDTVKVSPAGPTRGIASDSELDTIVEVVKAVKDSIGEMKLAVDLHGRLTPASSRRLLPRLAEFDLLFVEEPCLPEGSAQHLHDLRLLQTEQPLPLATGERLLTRREFADHLFPTPAIAVIQPDLAVVGGISEGVAIGAMAEAAQVALAPHCPYGPIQFAASIQVAAVSPAHFLQEYQSLGGAGAGGGIPGGGQQWEFDLLADTFSINDGHVQIPQGVGLGIEVCEDRISEHEESWNPHPPPLWQHPDGSHAEW